MFALRRRLRARRLHRIAQGGAGPRPGRAGAGPERAATAAGPGAGGRAGSGAAGRAAAAGPSQCRSGAEEQEAAALRPNMSVRFSPAGWRQRPESTPRGAPWDGSGLPALPVPAPAPPRRVGPVPVHAGPAPSCAPGGGRGTRASWELSRPPPRAWEGSQPRARVPCGRRKSRVAAPGGWPLNPAASPGLFPSAIPSVLVLRLARSCGRGAGNKGLHPARGRARAGSPAASAAQPRVCRSCAGAGLGSRHMEIKDHFSAFGQPRRIESWWPVPGRRREDQGSQCWESKPEGRRCSEMAQLNRALRFFLQNRRYETQASTEVTCHLPRLNSPIECSFVTPRIKAGSRRGPG
ncbi:translation initiation factor IF-2-like [Artibeus jamaicensis]|uniref:translation initiation factor IF-2-like n=1 Tax=Artibeus jamaicensis TaxID=9417 RepID=UPI00235AB86A|nr:translation initiation factor IF-2-like [Artibeus jamaicensis]